MRNENINTSLKPTFCIVQNDEAPDRTSRNSVARQVSPLGASQCSVGWAIPIALGVHPPSPSAFAPWSSRRLVACFHPPCRLPARLSNTILLAMVRKSTRSALRFLQQFQMSSPTPPVCYVRNLSYNPQDRRDIVRSVWRAVAELARIQSTGIAAVVVR